MSLKSLIGIARKKRYEIYKAPFKLNIWGVRSKNVKPNKFDDQLHIFFKGNGGMLRKWFHYIFPITTDPGTYWLKNPMNAQGTAMLAEGQYKNTYRIDLHRGKYYALCQRLGKVKVLRDYNRDAVLDFQNGIPEWGKFGINIHRARRTGTTYEVDNHSAGCQVFQKAEDFDSFMRLCEMHAEWNENKFTYTLIDQRMAFRSKLRRALMLTGGLGVLGSGLWYWNEKTGILNPI
ncbi:MAG: hypothetical protein MK086_14275 [Flavobacteriales bacterium]|nr:hypothetical protein [Flavobacteriales bacterium]